MVAPNNMAVGQVVAIVGRSSNGEDEVVDLTMEEQRVVTVWHNGSVLELSGADWHEMHERASRPEEGLEESEAKLIPSAAKRAKLLGKVTEWCTSNLAPSHSEPRVDKKEAFKDFLETAAATMKAAKNTSLHANFVAGLVDFQSAVELGAQDHILLREKLLSEVTTMMGSKFPGLVEQFKSLIEVVDQASIAPAGDGKSVHQASMAGDKAKNKGKASKKKDKAGGKAKTKGKASDVTAALPSPGKPAEHGGGEGRGKESEEAHGGGEGSGKESEGAQAGQDAGKRKRTQTAAYAAYTASHKRAGGGEGSGAKRRS